MFLEVTALFFGPGWDGRDELDFEKHAEVLMLPSLTTPNCKIPQFPESVYGYEMTAIEEGILLCGGITDADGSECFLLPFNGKEWLRSPVIKSMNKNRYYFSSAWLGNEWWVTGKDHLTTEVRAKNGTWTNFIDLPDYMSGYCMVTLDEHRVLFIGGSRGGSSRNSTMIYDRRTGSWETKQEMIDARGRHSCTRIDEDHVAVAGGTFQNETDFYVLDSVEIYSLRSETWRKGPPLPYGGADDQMVTANNATYYILGTKILLLDTSNATDLQWKEVGTTQGYKSYYKVVPIKFSSQDCNGWI